MVTIVQQADPVLRARAAMVPLTEIKSAPVRNLLAKMSTALASQPDGVALAAPQIGEAKRIFIIKDQPKDLVFINPRLIRQSRKKEIVEEGCLSVRWLYGQTKRSAKVTVEAYNENGKRFTRHGSGLMAQIFQHEIEHLDGILFTDHAKNLKEIKPETNNNE